MKNIEIMKMAIVGHGFVGKATDFGFKDNVEKMIIDPLYENGISDLEEFKPEIIFICVPTPMSEDGSQDASIIQSVVSELSIYCKNSIKVVKSTVLPSILRELVEIDKNIIYNPEFSKRETC